MHAAGLIEKIALGYAFRKLLSTRLHSSGNNEEIQRKLTLLDFQSAFPFLIVGHSLSVIVFVTEVCVGKIGLFQKRRKCNYDRRYI